MHVCLHGARLFDYPVHPRDRLVVPPDGSPPPVIDGGANRSIDQRFFADGLIDKAMVFKYIVPAYGEERTEWWVVAGDIPPFIDAVQPGETAIDVLRSYCKRIRLALDPSSDKDGLLEQFPPISYRCSTRPVEVTPELNRVISESKR